MVRNQLRIDLSVLSIHFSTCASGHWSCTQLDCSRTCSVLRNTHYTTFSGQYLKINSGSCEYTAARFKRDPRRFNLTLSNTASLEGRLTIDGTKKIFLYHLQRKHYILCRSSYRIRIRQGYSRQRWASHGIGTVTCALSNVHYLQSRPICYHQRNAFSPEMGFR